MKQAKKIELLEKIDSYIKGRLSQEEIDALWIEFLKYPEMFTYFKTEVQVQDMIKKGNIPESFKQDRVEEPKQTGPGYKVWFYATAAALALAIGLQFFSVKQQDINGGQWAVADIALNEMVGGDVFRSDESGTVVSGPEVQINSAMALAYNDSIEMAIEAFREILKRDLNEAQLARAELNLGILLYNSGQYEEAKNHFEQVTKLEGVRESLIEKGWWLYGNTLLNTGDIANAREAVYTAYGMNGRFQNPALALLKKLDTELQNSSSEQEQSP